MPTAILEEKNIVFAVFIKEFNHLSMIFLVLCKILCNYKSLAPSKSIPQKRNHDFTERYPNTKAGTYEPMRNKDILIKNRFFCRTPAF